MVLTLEKGKTAPRNQILRRLVDQQYERDEMTLTRGRFRIRGDTLTIFPAYEELAVRIEFFDDQVERIVDVSLRYRWLVLLAAGAPKNRFALPHSRCAFSTLPTGASGGSFTAST